MDTTLTIALIVAGASIIVGLLSLFGSIYAAKTAMRVANKAAERTESSVGQTAKIVTYRLDQAEKRYDQLEGEVKIHNGMIRRMVKAEKQLKDLETQNDDRKKEVTP